MTTSRLDADAYHIVKGQGKDASKFVSDTIKNAGKQTCEITSDKTEYITSNVPSEQKRIPTDKKSARYMTQDLEQEILKLRDGGMSLNQISKTLEQQGIVSASTGKPYSTGTLSKVITRIRSRQG